MAAEGAVDKPYTRVLVATEDTEFDSGSERVAIELAAHCDIPLRVVMPLVTNPAYQSLAPMREEKAEEEAAAKIESLTRDAEAKGVKLDGIVRLGEEPYREIVDEASKFGADLLVLRRRGQRSFLANLLLGEMVQTVTGHVQCDVLIVPRAANLWQRGIVLASDGSRNSERATEVAARVARYFNLPLTVLCSAETDEKDEQAAGDRLSQALELVRANGSEATGRLVSGGKPSEAVLKGAEAIGADLIVVGRRGLNTVQRALVGGTSEWLASHADCPILIVHAESPTA
jgi:universal stress protein E